MSTANLKVVLKGALQNIPDDFREIIINEYVELKKRSKRNQYDAAGISAGKYCETLIRYLQKEIKGTFTPFGEPISNFIDECRSISMSPKSTAQESIRIIIPRALSYLYTIRNKRGIGHLGGDVDANKIDLTTLVVVSDWIMCELIRIYHGLSLEEAQDLIDAISVRSIPTVWEVAGKKRVLANGINAQEKALLILYSDIESAILCEDLFDWIEYSDKTLFRSRVLAPLHEKRLIEYDKENEVVYISPLGVQEVEGRLNKYL